MALSAFEKIKVLKFVRERPMGKIFYYDLCKVLQRKRNANYIEFIEFFTQYSLDNLKKDNISFNLLSKFISCIDRMLNWCAKENIVVDEILVGKIRLINEYYLSMLKRSGKENDKEVDILLNCLNKTLDKLYPSKEDITQVSAYVKEIMHLQEQVKELSRQLDEKTRLYEYLEKELKDKDKVVKKKQDDVNLARNEAQKCVNEYNRLKREIADLKEAVSTLQRQIMEMSKLNEELRMENTSLSEGSEQLRISVNSLEQKIESMETLLEEKEKVLKTYEEVERRRSIEEQKQTECEIREQEIIDIILAKIASDGATIDELINSLALQGYDEVTKEAIYNYLIKIRQSINVSSSLEETKPKYVIVPPEVLTDGSFDIVIPEGCKCYDMLLTADYHLATFSEDVIKEFDKLLEYCDANNIKLVVNAGDFFCFKYSHKTPLLKGFTTSQKVVDRAISKLPHHPGVYHAVMGGNHDKDALNYGFDPIKKLTTYREDFISLGYDHVTITFNGQKSMLGSFMVHHPYTKFLDPVQEDCYNNESLIQSLNSYYANNNRLREDSYLDVLGHFHRSGLDTMNGICTIPSYTHDRFNNGAWHLKIYFDEKTQIKYMIFIPLDLKDKLVATTEIAYQRLILK